MSFCTAHRATYRPTPRTTPIPLADRRRAGPPSQGGKPGQIFTDWASI